MVFEKKKNKITYKKWCRGSELGWHAYEVVGNAVHSPKDAQGNPIPWLSHAVVLEIWSRFRQYVIEATEETRVSFVNAKTNEESFRRTLFGAIKTKECQTLDESYFKHGRNQLILLFQYQSHPILVHGYKGKEARYVPYAPTQPRGPSAPKGTGKGAKGKGDSKKGTGKGVKRQRPEVMPQTGTDFIVQQGKPFYDSYKGQKYCINWNLTGKCKFGKECSQLHFCSRIGCSKGHLFEGCRSGNCTGGGRTN